MVIMVGNINTKVDTAYVTDNIRIIYKDLKCHTKFIHAESKKRFLMCIIKKLI